MMKISELKTFFKESRLEFRHVNWLTKREAVNYTIIVIGLSLGLAAFLGVFDFAFSTLFNKFVI